MTLEQIEATKASSDLLRTEANDLATFYDKVVLRNNPELKALIPSNVTRCVMMEITRLRNTSDVLLNMLSESD